MDGGFGVGTARGRSNRSEEGAEDLGTEEVGADETVVGVEAEAEVEEGIVRETGGGVGEGEGEGRVSDGRLAEVGVGFGTATGRRVSMAGRVARGCTEEGAEGGSGCETWSGGGRDTEGIVVG